MNSRYNSSSSTLLSQYMESRKVSNDGNNTNNKRSASSQQLYNNNYRPATPNNNDHEESLPAPSASLTETKTYIRLTMNVPGIQRASDISVDIQRGILLIRGIRSILQTSDDDNDIQQAVKKQKFVRRFALDTDVVEKSLVRANLDKSVLVIMAPKKSAPSNIKIAVTENDQEEEDRAFLLTQKPVKETTATTVVPEPKSVLPEKTTVLAVDGLVTTSPKNNERKSN